MAILVDKVPENEAGRRVGIPGTGVSLVPLRDWSVAPIGAFLVDPEHKISVSAIIGPSRNDLTGDPLYMQGFPDPPATIVVDSTEAKLFRRTRAEHGGGFDAWWLNVVKGESLLSFQIAYTGDSAEYLSECERVMSSVSWDPSQVNTLKSFGVSVDVPELALDQRVTSVLSFTDTPELRDSSVNISIQAIPMSPGMLEADPSACRQILREGFGEQAHSGPTDIRTDHVAGCEAETSEADDEAEYRSMLVLDGRAVVFVMAEAERAKFKRWLPVFKRVSRELRITR